MGNKLRERKKAHLDEKCKACELLQQCGGSCVIARKSGDPYKEDIKPIDLKTGRIKPEFLNLNGPVPGHDYLRGDERE